MNNVKLFGIIIQNIFRFIVSFNVVTIGMAGNVADGACACNQYGIDAFFSIQKGAITLDEAMKKDVAKKNMTDTAEQIFRLIKAYT